MEDFKIMTDFYKDNKDINLLKQKGVYPYEYINSLEQSFQNFFQCGTLFGSETFRGTPDSNNFIWS